MKKKLKTVLITFISMLVLVAVGSFVWLQISSYDASISAETALEQAGDSEKNYDFFDSGQPENPGIIFYPGALVDSASYSIWAKQVAAAGYDVYLLKVPLDLAVLAGDRPTDIIKTHSSQRFIVGGHSLGGVMAARFTAKNSKQVEGLLLLASYPDKKGNLESSKLSVLSLTASNDKVLDWENYDDARQYLPESTTTYEEIEGGNHAGFGSYGAQKGDGKRTISNDEQQTEVAESIVEWLEKME